MSKVTGIKVDFLKSFLESFIEELNKLEENKSVYESADFMKLSDKYQMDFLSSVKNLQGNVWAMKKELELLDVMINKLFTNGPINQPSLEKAQEIMNSLMKKDSGSFGGNFH